MKTTAYLSLLYGLIVILSGIMAFRYADSLLSLFIEIIVGIIIMISVYFMLLEKKFAFYTVLILSLLLTIFYGYNFSQNNQFFQGLLTAISIFIAVFESIKIFKFYGR